jgi:hypothetical protein
MTCRSWTVESPSTVCEAEVQNFGSLLSGSPDISVRKGWQALTVAQATGSRRITTELGQLGSRLTRWESTPEVGQLLKELQAA